MAASDLHQLTATALGVSLPTFGWVALGLVMGRAGLLPGALVEGVSRLGFSLVLPLMLFTGAAAVDYSRLGSAVYLLAGVSTTLIVFALSWGYSVWRGHPRRYQGIFTQAAFRSNLAIVGIALCVSAYGERGTALAALPVAVMTVLYNILAVWVLDATLGSHTSVVTIVRGILRNPLIVGIAGGVVLSISGWPLPPLVADTGNLISQFFLPLVLVAIGASMQLSKLRGVGSIAWEAAAWRLLVTPALGVALCLAMGVGGEALGVMYLLLSSPVAAASFVMVVAARGDSTLAANLVVLTTLLSVVTVTLGFLVLSALGLASPVQGLAGG